MKVKFIIDEDSKVDVFFILCIYIFKVFVRWWLVWLWMVFLFGLGMLKKCFICVLNDNIFYVFSFTIGNVDYKVFLFIKVK